MSEFTVGLVVEGPRDVDIIVSVLYKTFPHHEFNIQTLQPEGGDVETEEGNGWKGVRCWCRDTAQQFTGLDEYMNIVTPKLDLLIVQIDTDIIYENDLDDPQFIRTVSPPVRDFEQNLVGGYDQVEVERKIELVRKYLFCWFDGKFPTDGYLQCIPSDNMEAWIIYAFNQDVYHSPPDKHIEKLSKPDREIAWKASFNGLKVPRKGVGKLRKTSRFYREHLIPKLLEKWPDIVQDCVQAREFENGLRKVFS